MFHFNSFLDYISYIYGLGTQRELNRNFDHGGVMRDEEKKKKKCTKSFGKIILFLLQIDGHDSGTESDGDLDEEEDEFNQDMDLSKYFKIEFFDIVSHTVHIRDQ